MENLLRSSLAEKRFVYSAELVLGRDHDVPEAESFVRDAAQEPNGVKLISATDMPGGNPGLPPEAFTSYVLEHGLTPIAHLSGKDGNRAFLEGRLHGLARVGVENILALTGDVPREAYRGLPKPVFDLESVTILGLIEDMRKGLQYQIGSRSLQTTPFDYLAGAVVNPYKVREPDQMMQYYKLQLKVSSGARFIIPQLGFNLRKLNELRQYMIREGMGDVPLLANVYVPTATVAKLMRNDEIPGCVVPRELIRRLEGEKKPQRLERAALLVAAAESLGFSGAHIGGFGLNHRDFMTIIEGAQDIGEGWRQRLDELVFEEPDQFYMLPPGGGGLSDGDGDYQLAQASVRQSWSQRLANISQRVLVERGTVGEQFFDGRLRNGREAGDDSWRRGGWYRLLSLSNLYRKAALDCVMCGDCVADRLAYATCPMSHCYKELRNGPCGGSRLDGSCEADPQQPCVWNLAYESTPSNGTGPSTFATTVVPSRDWSLDRTDALANRMAGLDNYTRRETLGAGGDGE